MLMRHLYKVLALRWLIIAACLAVGLGTAAAYALLAAPTYRSVAAVVVDVRADETIGQQARAEAMSPDYLLTLEDILKSDRVAMQVVESFEPNELQSLGLAYGWTPSNRPMKEYVASFLQNQMEVSSSLGSSRVMQIGFYSGNPDFSAAMANAYARAFMDVNLALQTEPARHAAEAYEQQLARKAEELEAAQQRLALKQRELGVVDPGSGSSADNVNLSTLATQLANATAAAEQARSQATGGALPAIAADPVITQLDVQLGTARSELAQLTTIAGPNNAQVRQLQNRIDALQAQRAQQVAAAQRRTSAQAAQARSAESGLQGQVAAQTRRTMATQESENELAKARLDVASVRQAYDQMAQRRTQLEVLGESGQTNIAMLTPAVPNPSKVGPKRILALVIGLVAGLLAGIVIAVGLELLSLRIRVPEELDAWLGIPDLGTIRSASSRTMLPRRKSVGYLPFLRSA